MSAESSFQVNVTTTSRSNMTPLQEEEASVVAAVAPEGCRVLFTDSNAFIPWDNPENILSQAVSEAMDTVVGTVCLPVLFLISGSTNVLNMLVFWRQGLRERINLCLFYLSLVDLLHMLHAFFCNVDRIYLPFMTDDEEFGPVFQFIVDHHLLGFRSLTWLSGFVSMVIACERCFCVVSPLRSQTVLSTRTTGLILAFATVFCVTGSLVNGSRWSLPCIFDPLTNTTSKRLLTSQFYARNRAHLNALTLFVATIQPTTYLTVIVATTIVMSVKLRKMTAWREQSTSSTSAVSSREVALTRMLIAVSLLYIVCSAPNMILGIGIMFVPGMSFSGRYYNLTMFFIDITELTSYINATFNFFIYYSLGSKYKNTLESLIFCRKVDLTTHSSTAKDVTGKVRA
ncbi:uncharacterized protein LOC143287932 [Babylonia areolata]|uniref:uncharacterized protein LOC143287932 n=1 Tax=Babylonia areolata TaxID=304850 RepID=UPI003FCFD3A2